MSVAEARRVETRHCHYPSLAHGFLSLTDDVDRAAAAMDAMTAGNRAVEPPSR